MSLVIIKVDREKKTHSIYCEGLSVSDRVVKTNQTKITHINNPKYSILIGTTGTLEFTRYFRIHFEEHFKKSDLFQNLGSQDFECESLKDITCNIWRSFCLDRRLPLDNQSFNSFGCILSINGYLYCIENYRCDGINTFDIYDIKDRDYCANGQEEVAALCLLENGIEVQRIFDTISKFNYHINNNVRSIENISYSDKM